MSLQASLSSYGRIRSYDALYLNARSGGTLTVESSLGVGQAFFASLYNCYEAFLRFDTSSIPDSAIIKTVTLELHVSSDQSVTDFIVEARALNWWQLDTNDWVPGYYITQELLATRDTSGGGSTYTFTSESAFLNAINKTGFTELYLNSSRHRLANVPTGNEYVEFDSGTLTIGWEQDLEAAFQGVAVFEGEAGVRYGLEADFQGVGSLTPDLSKMHGLVGNLQGVGMLEGETDGTFDADFSRYDAYLEDDDGVVGVIYYEDEGARKSTVSEELTPVRQDTGQNPFEIRPESGDLFSQGDFSHGAGQRYFHHEGRDPKKFLRSEGFDISEPGALTHLHDTASAFSDASVGVAVAIGGLPYVVSGNDVKKGDGAWPGTWTPEDPEGGESAGPVYDLTSSGTVGYAALGSNGIHKRDGTWSHYNDAQAKRVLWTKGRLMAASDTSMYEITGSGAAPTPIKTLPTGWTWEAIFEAGAYIYACAINTSDDLSEIYIFAPNADNTAIELKGSQEFPRGQLARAGCGYLNVTLLGAGKKNSSGGYDPVLYRAIPDDKGFLEYIKVAEDIGSGSVDCSVRAFLPLGESIVFGWSLGSGCAMGAARGGLGIFHIGTGAFATYLKGTAAANNVLSILAYGGRLAFSLASTGFYYEDLTKLVTTATLITSVADWNNAGSKLWGTLELAHEALAATTWVRIFYATEVPEAATTWKEALTSSVTGAMGKGIRMSNPPSRLFALKLESHSNSGQTAAPEIASFGSRSYPYPTTREYALTRYVRLSDVDRKDAAAEEIRQDASELYLRLLGLAHSFVRLYEPGVTWNARMKRVGGPEPYLASLDPSGDETTDFYIVQLTLTATL